MTPHTVHLAWLNDMLLGVFSEHRGALECCAQYRKDHPDTPWHRIGRGYRWVNNHDMARLTVEEVEVQ